MKVLIFILINFLLMCTRTYIRGQNVPIDPDVYAEREKKREAALKHQEEIRKQVRVLARDLLKYSVNRFR
jgi:hypothetical protein